MYSKLMEIQTVELKDVQSIAAYPGSYKVIDLATFSGELDGGARVQIINPYSFKEPLE
jgi:hypothetical protein